MINKRKLMELLGLSEGTARDVIRRAKDIMVEKGYPFYLNRRLGSVPVYVVKEILGDVEELEMMNGGIDNEQ